MNRPVDYDHSMEGDSQNWTAQVRQAVADFTKRVSETSQQLAEAADKFALDSMKVIDDVTNRAEESASRSSQMATAASSAAEEARTAAESVRSSLNEAAQKVREETNSLIEDAVQNLQRQSGIQERLDTVAQRAEQAIESSQQLHSDIEMRLNNMLAQAGGAAERVRSDLEERLSRLSQPSGLSDEVAAAIDSRIENAVTRMQSAMQGVDQMRLDIEERFSAALRDLEQSSYAEREAAAEATRAATEAREAANAATQELAQVREAPASPVSESAQLVLERLEADYSLLTKLVQELHARITNLANQTPTPLPVQQQPTPALEPASPWAVATPAPVDEVVEELQVEPVTPVQGWNYSQPEPEAEPVSASIEPEPTYEPEPSYEPQPGEPEPIAAAPAGSESQTVAGRLLISIAPVPDFDRLLSLDGALGRMTGVINVTLADYAKEEVTFRIEVQTPTSVEDFRQRLSQSAGSEIDVVSSSEGGLALRLAS